MYVEVELKQIKFLFESSLTNTKMTKQNLYKVHHSRTIPCMLKVNFKVKEFLQINKWSTVYIAYWPPYVQTKRTKDDLLLEGGSEVLKFIPTMAVQIFQTNYGGPKIAHYLNLALKVS